MLIYCSIYQEVIMGSCFFFSEVTHKPIRSQGRGRVISLEESYLVLHQLYMAGFIHIFNFNQKWNDYTISPVTLGLSGVAQPPTTRLCPPSYKFTRPLTVVISSPIYPTVHVVMHQLGPLNPMNYQQIPVKSKNNSLWNLKLNPHETSNSPVRVIPSS